MSESYLLRILPVDVSKGQKAEVVIKTPEGKQIITTDIPYKIISERKSEANIKDICKRLMCYPYKDLNLALEQKDWANTGDKVLQVSGKREDLTLVRKQFRSHFNAVSVPEWLRLYAKFPFSKVKVTDNKIEFLEDKISFEQLKKEKVGGLDIETNKKAATEDELIYGHLKYEEINTAAFACCQNNELKASIFTCLETESQEITLQTRAEPYKKKFENYLEYDLAVLRAKKGDKQAGQKIVTYCLEDVLACLGLPPNTQVRAEIKYVRDWQQIPELLSKQIVDSGIVFLRGHNIMGFDLLELRDRPEEEEAFLPAMDDTGPKITAQAGFGKRVEVKDFFVVDTYGLARFYLPYLPNKKLETVCEFFQDFNVLQDATVLISRAAECSTETVCSILKKGIGLNFWNKRTYRSTNSFDFFKGNPYYNRLDISKEKIGLLESLSPEKIAKGFIQEKNLYAVYLNNLLGAFDFIKSDKTAAELYNAWQTEKNPHIKFIFQQALDMLCEKPLYDLTTAPEKVFWGKYKRDAKRTKEASNQIKNKINEFFAENKIKILNYTDDLLFISAENPLEEKLSNFSYLQMLGRVDALYSQKQGVVVASLEGKLISQGISLGGNRGILVEKARQLEIPFFKKLLVAGDRMGALKLMHNELAYPLAQKMSPKPDLLIRLKLGMEPDEYSLRARDRFNILCAKKLREKGYEVKAGEAYYFGLGSGPGENYDLLLMKDFFSSDVRLNDKVVREYQSLLFGPDTKFYKIFNTLYNPKSNSDVRQALSHICHGCASDKDWLLVELASQKEVGSQSLVEQFRENPEASLSAETNTQPKKLRQASLGNIF